ncbi:hypothetical protein F4553_007938 [Allocatelliglobosispora scoriae]|uniref:Ricin B lectin domain-containing protein n=1 Tax=Allocatelliglobosispora scoriae TaxID=643052 RepID=A0A841C2C3_9ACTN|nr:hypothetical protein [Allocatelliglobosispora scoriae]MBB5874504.1 hypothetical protein [Allocatelliglobosispora scoriae]
MAKLLPDMQGSYEVRPCAASQTSGIRPALWDCNNGFNQDRVSTTSNQLKVFDTRCLEAAGGATADGTAVQIYHCAKARPPSSGGSAPTAPSSESGRASAWMPPGTAPPTARCSSSGPAASPTTRSGRVADDDPSL